MSGPGLLAFGYGYSAASLAASLPPHWRKWGTTRTPEKARDIQASGVAPLDWSDAGAIDAALMQADHLLISVPPDDSGDPVLARHREAIEAGPARWIGYLSTTGVYGDRQGGWVDENSALDPVNPRSRRRVAAERDWRSLATPAHLFRLAGIYGPGRNALERVAAGRATRVIKKDQVFSRIHVDDIAGVLRASIAEPQPGRAYNVADDEPAPPQDVIAFAAELLGRPVPPGIAFEDAELSAMARSFYAESKRVSNRRIREELGVDLRYPTYRAGLTAILRARL